jgi:hypothetical protein
MASVQNSNSRFRESLYLAIVLLPMIGLAITIAAALAREGICSSKVNAIVAKVKATAEIREQANAVVSPDVSSLESNDRFAIARAAEHLRHRYGEVIGKLPLSAKLLPSGKPNECEKVLANFSSDAKPVIEAYQREVARNGQPPNDGRFYIHDLDWVTDLEFRRAYHAGDTKRVLEMLELLWLNTDRIFQSLENDVWSLADLEKLREMVAPSSVSDGSWASSVGNKELNFIAELDRANAGVVERWNRRAPMGSFGVAPSHALACLTALSRAKEMRAIGTQASMIDANQIEQDVSAFSLVSVPFARHAGLWIKNDLHNFWRNRMESRRLITAIAIKTFKLQEGQWPERLDDLTNVGLTSPDWKIVDNHDFGYRVIEDGKAALLWTGGAEYIESPQWHENSFRTPAQPPSEVYLNTSAVAKLESRIR